MTNQSQEVYFPIWTGINKKKKKSARMLARLHPHLRKIRSMCYVSAFSHGCTHAWLLRLPLQNVLVFHKVNKLPHTYVLLKYTFSISYTNSLYLSPISQSGCRNILISGCHLLIFIIFVSLFNCNCYNLFICQIYVLDSRTARASPILEHVSENSYDIMTGCDLCPFYDKMRWFTFLFVRVF